MTMKRITKLVIMNEKSIEGGLFSYQLPIKIIIKNSGCHMLLIVPFGLYQGTYV